MNCTGVEQTRVFRFINVLFLLHPITFFRLSKKKKRQEYIMTRLKDKVETANQIQTSG